MKPTLYIVAFWGLVLIGVWIYTSADVPQPPGVLAPEEPRQTETPQQTWDRGDAHFMALAQFEMRGRVLSTSHYYFDTESSLAPVDLALGWGRMSDTSVIEELSIAQGRRYYMWRQRSGHALPIPPDEIISHSANMHMIPANGEIEKKLEDVRKGHVVELKGFLVMVTKPGGWRWKSSLSRTDTGMGACELVWVEALRF
jgi:hypothetical protein